MAERRTNQGINGRVFLLRAGIAALTTSALLFVSLTIGAGVSAASDQAQTQAKKYLLVRSDMPKGWTIGKASTSEYSTPLGSVGDQQLASCLGVPLSVLSSPRPQAAVPDFVDSDAGLIVGDTVTVFPSINSAHIYFAAMENGKLAPCLAPIANSASFKSHLLGPVPKGRTLGRIT
jgi:hypothetical protein